MNYLAHVEGFSGQFATIADLRDWATALNNRYHLNGKILKIFKATWVARDGSGASYNAVPSHELVITE